MNYTVSFVLDEPKSETFEADNPGAAFALCLKKYPEATLTGASTEARIGERGFGKINYDPPPVQRAPFREPRPARKPRKTEPYESFPF